MDKPVISLQTPSEINSGAKEREQSLARELNLRAPEEERAQALVPEINLQAEDKILPSQAGTEPLRWTTMSANKEATIVINPLALRAPTTTLKLGPVNQAKLDAVRRSRIDGTYTPPAGMVEWQRLNPSKAAREWIIWRNNQKAEAEVAKEKKLKLLPFETRPFNYARLKEDEASQLHVLSLEGNKDDDNSAGIAQEEGDEQVEGGNEHFSPSSSEDSLGEDLDRLFNSSSAVPFLNDATMSQEQREDELVDYNEDDDEDEILRNEEDKTTRAKTFADILTEVEAQRLSRRGKR